MSISYDQIVRAFADTNLVVRGGFKTNPNENPASNHIVLIGNTGPDMWDAFAPHNDPATTDPLDTWTKSVVAPRAASLGATAFYPNDKPYQPFQQWAVRCEPVTPSPLGILIHPDHGLWHAYRAALTFDRPVTSIPTPDHVVSPCENCADKPCLTTCPVDAFTRAGYDIPACVTHLHTSQGQPCHDGGCQARMACPIAPDARYSQAQRAFHAAAFFRSHK